MTKGSGQRFFGRVLVAGFLLITTGCFFNLSGEKDFKSWYYGQPGMAGALGESRCDPYADRIQGDRHPYYLHFRTLEVLYQPQGGVRYPERSTVAALDAEGGRSAFACELVQDGRETFNFNAVDAGLVDVMIPFRKATATSNADSRPLQTGSYASSVVINAGIAAVMKAPVYLVHDVLKTLYVPVAGTYFLLRADDTAPTEADPADRLRSASTDLGTAPAEVEAVTDTALEAESQTPSPEVADEAIPAEIEDLADEKEPARETQAAAENTLAEVPEPTGAAPEPTPRSSAPARPGTVASAADPTEPGEGNEASLRADAVPSAATDQAPAGVLTATPTGPPTESEPVVASPSPAIAEEDLREASDGEAVEAADGASSQSPMMATARDEELLEADRGAAEREADGISEAGQSEDALGEMASIAESPPARPDTPSPLPALEEVSLSKRNLSKRVAFLGFSGPASTGDPEIKGLFEERIWPALTDECRRRMALVKTGAPGFPTALEQLSRDQFGRLNSFEVTTLARLNGINAVVTGAIIDVRLSNEIRGVLWYKEPEGRLRVAVLVEVYDAETGTKLLDKTLVHETEVEELEPGGEARLRDQDMVFLQMALGEIAADMSELVCEVLEEQPWRAFVTGIDGSRITLSAGSASGLMPGHVLAVYNSQIIEGLNNQQFFLTGERVGRLQITRVYPDHAEAQVLEGVDHINSYSLVLPES